MLTHLLFSISALIFMVTFMITYFSYKNNTNSVRSKVYVSMIYYTLALTLTEIIEGISYVYDIDILFSLMWKLHSVFMTVFIVSLFYYYLVTIADIKVNNVEELLWDNKKLLSIRNLFTIIFTIMIVVSMVIVKTYPIGLTMFYFYTEESIKFILLLYIIYIVYNMYVLYIKWSLCADGSDPFEYL